MRKLLMTRRLPEAVIAAAGARFDVTLRDDTSPLGRAEIAGALGGYDLVLPTLGRRLRRRGLRRGAGAALQASCQFRGRL